MSDKRFSIIGRDRLIIEVKGFKHPIIGHKITAMILTESGLEMMTDDGNVFLAAGAKEIIKIGGRK